MGAVSTETKAGGLWKRRTLPDVLPSSLDLSKVRSSLSPPPHGGPGSGSGPGSTPSPTKAFFSSPSSSSAAASPFQPGSGPAQSPPGGRPASSSPSRKKSLGAFRRASIRATLFSASPDHRSGRSAWSPTSPGDPGGSRSGSGPGSGSSPTRTTRKFLYSLASITMQSRRNSGGSSQKGRRESMGLTKLFSMTANSVRRTSAEKAAAGGFNKMATLATLVGLKNRAHARIKEARTKMMWRKLRLWSKIIHVLSTLLHKHADAAMNDPASPFYSHGSGMEDPLGDVIDKDHYMFFDPSQFKANRQRRMSQEVQRILTKAPQERTPEEIHFAMIGLRDIPQLAVFPVRMQRNVAQFGEFQNYEAKRMIVKQGHKAEGYYFILYGTVVVAVKSEETGFAKVVVELPRGEAFGELAIVSGGSRNSSVLTKTYTELLVISKEVYETIFMTGGMKNINDPDQDEFVSSLQFLRGWPVQKMSEKNSEKNVRFMYIQRNGVITRNSNINSWLIVVKSGSVTVLKKLVRSSPTVSSRSGVYRDTSCSTAYQTFLTDRKEHLRWMEFHNVTLPPPLQLHEDDHSVDQDEEDELDEDEADDVGDGKEKEEVVDDEEEDGDFDGMTEEEREGRDRYADNEQDRKVSHAGHDGIEVEELDQRHHFRSKPVRPQTCVQGKQATEPLQAKKPVLRKAWSANQFGTKHRASILCKRTRLKKAKIHFEAEPKDEEKDTEIPPEVKFAAAKRTLLDDLDAAYLSRDNPVTEADRKPQFVYVHTLTKGDVFGLAPLVFPDQPSLCLVSNGAECMFIDKRFYMDNCPPELSRRLKTEVSPYPSEQKLQQDLVNRINWDVYKRVVKRQVYQQSPTRITIKPL